MGKVNSNNLDEKLGEITNNLKASNLDKVIDLVDSLEPDVNYNVNDIQWNTILDRAIRYENWNVIEKVISFLVNNAGDKNISFVGTFLTGALRQMNHRSDIKRFFSLVEDNFNFNDDSNRKMIAEIIQCVLTQKNESLDDETKDLIKYFKEKGIFKRLKEKEIEDYYFDKMNEEKFRYLVVDCDIYGDCLEGDNNNKEKLVVDALLSKKYDEEKVTNETYTYNNEEKNDSTVNYNMAEVLLDMPGLDKDKLKIEITNRKEDIGNRFKCLLEKKMYDKLGVFFRLQGIGNEQNSKKLLERLKKKIDEEYVKKLFDNGDYYKMFKISSISEDIKAHLGKCLEKSVKKGAKKNYKGYIMNLIYKKRYDELEEIYELGFIKKEVTKNILKELIKEADTQKDIKGYIKNVMGSFGSNRKLEKIYKLPFDKEYILNEIKEYVEELIVEINDGGKENFNIDKLCYHNLKRVCDISFIEGEWIKEIVTGKIREDMKEEVEEVLKEWIKMANKRRISEGMPSQSDIADIKNQYVDAIKEGGDVVGIFKKFGTGENPSKEDGVTILLLVMSRYIQNKDKEKIDVCVEILRKEIALLDVNNDWNSIVNDIVVIGEVDILKKFCEIVKNEKELKIDWNKILQVVYYNEDMDIRKGMLDILIKDCRSVFGIEWEERLINMNKDNNHIVEYIINTYRENLNEFKLLSEAIDKREKDLVKSIMDECAKEGKAYDILKSVLQRVAEDKDVFGDLVIRYGNNEIRNELFSALYNGRSKAKWTGFLNRDEKIKKDLQRYFLEDASRVMYICKDTGALKHIEREYNELYKGKEMAGALLFEAAKKEDLDLIKHLIDTVIEGEVDIKGTNRRWLEQIKLSPDKDLYDDVIRHLVKKKIKLLLDVENFLAISEHIKENIGATGLDKVECDKESIRSIGDVMSIVSRRRKKVSVPVIRSIGIIEQGKK